MVLKRPAAALLALAVPATALAASARAAETAVQQVSAAPAVHSGRYIVRKASSHDLWLEPPVLPDLRPYTRAAIEAKIVRKHKASIAVRRVVEAPALHEFVTGGRLGEWTARQRTMPVAIFIENGYATPRDLAQALPDDQFAETAPGIFLARLPIVVQQGATLHIDPATKDFRMSEERGSFLVNDGMLFIIGTRLTAWREQENGPAKHRNDKGKSFRPFLNAWGGSQTYIAESQVASLGYSASKSYGVSISQYSPTMDAKLRRPRPTGWIIDSEFRDNWYGFYCYEADDIVVIRSKYLDNIAYGIDPHDRSRRLIIAENVASGVQQKHGIIISREVNDSWIFRNRANGNRLAGIVLDRNCSNNVVADNEANGNSGDGITIYESHNNLVWNNRVAGNARHGIRLRNSVDIRLYGNIVVANALTGIYGHIKDLTGTDRDLKLDPFELNISMVVVGGQLVFNGSGPIAIDQPLSVEMYGVDLLAPTRQSGLRLSGILGDYQDDILDILVRQRAAAVIEPLPDPAASR